MKLVTFFYDEQERIGAIDHSGNVVDLINAYGSYLSKVEQSRRRSALGRRHPRQ